MLPKNLKIIKNSFKKLHESKDFCPEISRTLNTSKQQEQPATDYNQNKKNSNGFYKNEVQPEFFLFSGL